MRRLRIILIAHDDKKTDLVEWTRFNAGTLCRHDLIATAATGEVIQDIPGLTVRTLLHGPAGGDAQAGALIATGEADVLVFFWEPLEVQPHDVDVKALLRLAVLHNVPTACNRATADYLIVAALRDLSVHRPSRNTMLRAAMRHAMFLRGRHGRR
jgi:methylglyoxal synthase